MKKNLSVVLLLLAFVIGSAQPVKEHGRLKVTGVQLLDEKGAPVVLRGMSFGWHNWWPRFYTAGTVSWLKKIGVVLWYGQPWVLNQTGDISTNLIGRRLPSKR
ncbi:hypothetical protein [Paraflavitalea speifideaquila]|uniref:hypothetical protein n=1 Tax=Paraflavitalea speifideaquila TaxID=3076558 RepID=UPI0028E7F5E3|nr:hypothetical protein [Paraflavitalea speifideiaquila]